MSKTSNIYKSKTKNLEYLIVITKTFPINLLSECKIIFIDGNFRSSQKSFYQVLNVIFHLNTKNL